MKYTIWLQQALSFGYGKTAAIFDRFGSAYGVYTASDEQLYNSGLFTPKALESAKNKSLEDAEKILAQCSEQGINVIAYGDSRYPCCLANLPDFPLVLYFKGEMPDFDSIPSVCIVGPRESSDFGVKSAYSLSARLARGGMTIVSGGAKGVDSAAHRGALAEDSPTVLIMPCGFGYDYLKENENLREEIINRGGVIITEYPPKHPVTRGTFQVRNRLMSALALGTVVIEADSRSGALITARHALEQGKDIFVIPGNPTLPQYEGSNRLLQDGAKAVLTAKDIFFEYISAFKDKLDIEKAYSRPLSPMSMVGERSQKTQPQARISVDTSVLSPIAASLYAATPDDAFCVDELSVFCDYDASELMTAITELELCGFVKAVPGGRYLKVQ